MGVVAPQAQVFFRGQEIPLGNMAVRVSPEERTPGGYDSALDVEFQDTDGKYTLRLRGLADLIMATAGPGAVELIAQSLQDRLSRFPYPETSAVKR